MISFFFFFFFFLWPEFRPKNKKSKGGSLWSTHLFAKKPKNQTFFKNPELSLGNSHAKILCVAVGVEIHDSNRSSWSGSRPTIFLRSSFLLAQDVMIHLDAKKWNDMENFSVRESKIFTWSMCAWSCYRKIFVVRFSNFVARVPKKFR